MRRKSDSTFSLLRLDAFIERIELNSNITPVRDQLSSETESTEFHATILSNTEIVLDGLRRGYLRVDCKRILINQGWYGVFLPWGPKSLSDKFTPEQPHCALRISYRLCNHPDFVGVIPILLENPESRSICDRIRKIPIWTRVVIFSSNSHIKKKMKCRILNSDVPKN